MKEFTDRVAAHFADKAALDLRDCWLSMLGLNDPTTFDFARRDPPRPSEMVLWEGELESLYRRAATENPA